jgi:hypothetical protein
VEPETKVFRVVGWQIAMAGAFAFGGVVTLGALLRDEAGGVAIAVCSLVTLITMAALAHALTTRIALKEDGLVVVANFRRRFLPRAMIETVAWERGSGVSVKLVGGGWLKLPETGHDSQVRANTIRAWLKRTPAVASRGRRQPVVSQPRDR